MPKKYNIDPRVGYHPEYGNAETMIAGKIKAKLETPERTFASHEEKMAWLEEGAKRKLPDQPVIPECKHRCPGFPRTKVEEDRPHEFGHLGRCEHVGKPMRCNRHRFPDSVPQVNYG